MKSFSFSFRDVLHTKYKSSTKAKSNRKKNNNTNIRNDDSIISMEEQVFNLNDLEQKLSCEYKRNFVAIEGTDDYELGFETNEAIVIQHEPLDFRLDSFIYSNNIQNDVVSNFEMFPVRHNRPIKQNTLIKPMSPITGMLPRSYQDLIVPLEYESNRYDSLHCDELSDWMTDIEQQQFQQNLSSDFFDWDIDTLF